MDHASIHSLFQAGRKDHLIHSDLDTQVFRLPPPYQEYAVKFDLEKFEDNLLASTTLKPNLHGLPRTLALPLLISDTGVEVHRFLEGQSLRAFYDKHLHKFQNSPLPLRNSDRTPFDRAKRLASRATLKMLSELPDDHYIPMMQDIHDLTNGSYAIDPSAGNIMITAAGLRIIDAHKEATQQYNCAKAIKEELNYFLEASKIGGEDADLRIWKNTIYKKIDTAAKKCGVGGETARKPRPLKRRMAFAAGSTVEASQELNMQNTPAALGVLLKRMDPESQLRI